MKKKIIGSVLDPSMCDTVLNANVLLAQLQELFMKNSSSSCGDPYPCFGDPQGHFVK